MWRRLLERGSTALARSTKALNALNEAAEMGDVRQAETMFAAPGHALATLVGSGGLSEGHGQAAHDGVQHCAEGWEKDGERLGAALERPMRTGVRRKKQQLGSARWSHGECGEIQRPQLSKREKMTCRSYGKVIEAFAKCGDVESALMYLAKMMHELEVDPEP